MCAVLRVLKGQGCLRCDPLLCFCVHACVRVSMSVYPCSLALETMQSCSNSGDLPPFAMVVLDRLIGALVAQGRNEHAAALVPTFSALWDKFSCPSQLDDVAPLRAVFGLDVPHVFVVHREQYPSKQSVPPPVSVRVYDPGCSPACLCVFPLHPPPAPVCSSVSLEQRGEMCRRPASLLGSVQCVIMPLMAWKLQSYPASCTPRQRVR